MAASITLQQENVYGEMPSVVYQGPGQRKVLKERAPSWLR